MHKYLNVFSLKYVPFPLQTGRCTFGLTCPLCSDTFVAQLNAQAVKCSYAGYYEKYMTYPLTGRLPIPGTSTEADPGCDVWDEPFFAALNVNPAFNIYRIFDTVCARQSRLSVWRRR